LPEQIPERKTRTRECYAIRLHDRENRGLWKLFRTVHDRGASNARHGEGDLRFFLNDGLELSGDAMNELHRHLKFADGLDRLGKLNLALIDFKALRRKRRR
jgi:hypothetical protein